MRTIIGLILWGCLALGCEGSTDGKADGENEETTVDELAEYDCRPHTLEEACESVSCPTSPDDVGLECGSELVSSTRAATTCGGTIVSINEGFTGKRWVFDADDNLVGVVAWTDIGAPCPNGGDSSSVTYGSVCEGEGELEDLCEANDGCSGELLACAADQSCPATPDAIAAEHCTPETSVVSLATLCGGIRVYVSGEQNVSYCFNAEGALIGRKNAAAGIDEGLDCVGEGPATDSCEAAP